MWLLKKIRKKLLLRAKKNFIKKNSEKNEKNI